MTEPVAFKLGFIGNILPILSGAIALAMPFGLGLVSATQGRAQIQAEDIAVKLSMYDVASIKPGKSGMGSTLLFRLDGFTAKGMTLKALMREAYGIENDQILGAPNWLNTQTYDIEAKVDGADAAALERLSEDQRKLMFQSFLKDRFQLKVHRETKELPVLALVIAKNGPQLQEAKPGDTYPDGIKGPDGKPAGHAGMMMWGNGRLTGQGISIAAMVPPLTQQLGRTVLDKTGLTGRYDVELRWTPDNTSTPASGPDSGTAAESQTPSIFTAIQEQLGLKLESQKAPVEVLVIDHVAAPAAN
ncbi:MAG TPA: TIGR03435 family protein [Acidobacteriaceae bacterium]|nr:TIGR03435 family protein [Acidobacteriaceae bacterium]